MSVVERERIFGGRYRVVGILGDGGMARVYKAVDERLGRAVAVKALHDYYNNQPAFVTRFEQEAKLAAGLNHPNIIGVYDIGHDDGGHYIVMEYVEGDTLKRLVEREAPFTVPTATAILRQICLALDYAHARGVVHRDVKPENIFLTAERAVKVGDFGIAHALDSTTLTPAGMVLGSVSYLAPEQALGQRTTGQADLYATGVVLYEMLTGRVPFVAETALGVAMMHLNDDPIPPSHYNPALPPGIDRVVLTALAKDPARRYRTGADLTDALARADADADGTRGVGPADTDAMRSLVRPTTPSEPATRLLDPRPLGLLAEAQPTRVIPAPAVSPDALTTRRPTDMARMPPPDGRVRSPRGAVPAAAPARNGRALIPLVVPLLAVLLVAGAVKAATGGHDGRGGRNATGRTGVVIPTATAAATSTRTVPLRVRSPLVLPSATSSHTARGRRGHARAHRSARPIGGASGGAADYRYGYATLTTTPRPGAVSTSVAPTPTTASVAPIAPPVVAPPTEAAPTSTATTYSAPVGGASVLVGPTETPPPPATATYAPPAATATYTAPPATDIPTQQATDTPIDATPGTGDAPTDTPQAGPGAPAGGSGQTAPTGTPMGDTPLNAGTAVPTPTADQGAQGDQGVPSSFNLNKVAASAQALNAVDHANDVYMQVMNGPDASAVDTAYGPYLANVNRGVAATLAANHQHWRISLVGAIGLSNAQLIDANTVRVTVTKTENAELLSDAGQVIKPPYTDTETFVDIVQRIDGRWLVTQVYH